MIDLKLILIIAGGVILLLAVIWLMRRSSVRYDILDELEDDTGNAREADDLGTMSAFKPEERKKKPAKRKAKKSRKVVVDSGQCDHNFEITGFPADFLGTHVNLQCSKCGMRQTVTIEESRELMRQRDDVRDAMRRARS